MAEEFTGNDLDIQSLRVLKAIADEGSITAAADHLGYSQPAVSQQLRRLEARIGLAVVERVGRSVRLTEAGRILARYAPAVTTALDAAAEELAEVRGLRAGRVRLVGFPSASPVAIPRMLNELSLHHPGLEVTYVEAEPPEAVEAVREDRADIALTFSYPGDRNDPHVSSAHGLSVTPIGSDELLAILAKDHPAVANGTVELADLATEHWIAGCPRCRGHLMEVCDRAGFEPHIAFETDNVVAVEGLVSQGIGVALLPRMAVEAFPQLPGVTAVPLPAADKRTIHLVTAHGAERVPSVRAVLAALTRAIEEL